ARRRRRVRCDAGAVRRRRLSRASFVRRIVSRRVCTPPRGKPGDHRMTALDPFSIPITGVALVDASAGTGKTHTIATLFVRLVLERALEVDRILVVTFTKAATAELRDRIRRRLGEALQAFETGRSADPTLAELVRRTRDAGRARKLLAVAVASADQAAVLTIHGFCQRVLE